MSPLETLELIRKYERNSGELLKEALSLPRYYNHSDFEILRRPDAFYLPAMNATARINWAGSFFAGLCSHFKLRMTDEGPDVPMFLVTIADKAHLLSAQSAKVNFGSIRRKLSGALQGLTYVGMIEPAYFNAIYDESGRKIKDVVSWHGHFLVWDIDRKGLHQWRRKIQARIEPVCADRCAVHIKEVTPNRFGHIVWYVNKSPRTEYSIGRRSVTDQIGRPRYKANSRPLRPGHRVQLFRMMRGVTLPELAMAGGDGRKLLPRIKYVAKKAGGRKRRRYWRGSLGDHRMVTP
jgi:hypothetical protein